MKYLFVLFSILIFASNSIATNTEESSERVFMCSSTKIYIFGAYIGCQTNVDGDVRFNNNLSILEVDCDDYCGHPKAVSRASEVTKFGDTAEIFKK